VLLCVLHPDGLVELSHELDRGRGLSALQRRAISSTLVVTVLAVEAAASLERAASARALLRQRGPQLPGALLQHRAHRGIEHREALVRRVPPVREVVEGFRAHDCASASSGSDSSTSNVSSLRLSLTSSTR